MSIWRDEQKKAERERLLWIQKKHDAFHAASDWFDRRHELIDKQSLTEAEETELEELRGQIAALPTAPDEATQKNMDFIRDCAVVLRKTQQGRTD